MTDNTDIRQLADLPIANVLFPDKAGPRMLPYNVPIAAGVEFVLDLMQAQLTAKENRIQAMEVDNTRGGADVIIQMGFQRIQVAAGEIQLIPLYVTGSPLQFFCGVANVVPVKFFNVPMPAYTRSLQATRFISGLAQNTVAALLPAIPDRSYVIKGLYFSLLGGTIRGVAGDTSFILGGGFAANPRADATIPAAAGGGFATSILDIEDCFVKGAVNTAVSLTFSAALTGGGLSYNIKYTIV